MQLRLWTSFLSLCNPVSTLVLRACDETLVIGTKETLTDNAKQIRKILTVEQVLTFLACVGVCLDGTARTECVCSCACVCEHVCKNV